MPRDSEASREGRPGKGLDFHDSLGPGERQSVGVPATAWDHTQTVSSMRGGGEENCAQAPLWYLSLELVCSPVSRPPEVWCWVAMATSPARSTPVMHRECSL